MLLPAAQRGGVFRVSRSHSGSCDRRGTSLLLVARSHPSPGSLPDDLLEWLAPRCGSKPAGIYKGRKPSTDSGVVRPLRDDGLGPSAFRHDDRARLSGQALAQTAVTLDANAVIRPAP